MFDKVLKTPSISVLMFQCWFWAYLLFAEINFFELLYKIEQKLF